MMKKTFPLVAAALILSGPLYAECTMPKDVAIPDGATATMDQMVSAQTEVKSYVAKGQEYLTCRDQEMEAMGDDMSSKEKVAYTESYNAFVDKLTAVGNAFNAQIKAYREANPQ